MQGGTDGEVLAQFVVERTNGFELGRHCCISRMCERRAVRLP